MKSLLLSAFAMLACPVFAQAPAGSESKLLDKVIMHPGSYSQVCDMMSMPADIPYRAYQLTDFAGASFSKANLAAIGKNRDALVTAIRARLLAIDFKRAAVEVAKDPKPEDSEDGENIGCDPKSLNPLLLNLIIELHAVEALPELRVVEDRLVKGIAVAKDDAKAAPPVVKGWFVGIEGPYDDSEPEARRDRKINLFQSRIAQRDLVITMALLMREKSYQPFLNSSIEAAYVKGLKAQVKENHLDKFKPGQPLPKELEYLEISIDPISRLPRMDHTHVSIPYTRESRDEVRAAAAKWIEEHP